jgi:hypothetical protein
VRVGRRVPGYFLNRATRRRRHGRVTPKAADHHPRTRNKRRFSEVRRTPQIGESAFGAKLSFQAHPLPRRPSTQAGISRNYSINQSGASSWYRRRRSDSRNHCCTGRPPRWSRRSSRFSGPGTDGAIHLVERRGGSHEPTTSATSASSYGLTTFVGNRSPFTSVRCGFSRCISRR